MSPPIVTTAKRDALLRAYGLNPWPTIMTPEKAWRLRRPAHVNIEATYRKGHFEAPNFEGLRLEGRELYALLQDGVRYRVEGIFFPGNPPDNMCVGYNGPRLQPFVIEAITQGRLAEHAGLRVRAHRSPGVWERNGYGDYTAPRASSVDVLTGERDGVVYVAVIRGLNRPGEFNFIHGSCRSAWRGLFPGGSSLFWLREVAPEELSSASVDLPSDPAKGVLAVRERLLESLQRVSNDLGIDGVILAVSDGAVSCLRMGKHRLARRTGDSMSTVLWEHTLYRYPPPEVPISQLRDCGTRFLLSSLQPGVTPPPVHGAPTHIGDQWLIISGQLLSRAVEENISDETFGEALRGASPDELAARLGATAAKFPDKDRPDHLPAWSLVTLDLASGAPEAVSATGDRGSSDINPADLLAQLHELEKNRT